MGIDTQLREILSSRGEFNVCFDDNLVIDSNPKRQVFALVSKNDPDFHLDIVNISTESIVPAAFERDSISKECRNY